MSNTTGQWQRADEIMAGECERMFQNGGPRVYLFEPEHSRLIKPSGMSAARTLRCAFPGAYVYARRKVEGRYRWMWATKTAASPATIAG